MLFNVNDLKGFELRATDGEIGKTIDFLFDDEQWAIRYMDARAGNWLTGQRVLISPISLGSPDWEAEQIPVHLSQEQIRNSPSLATDQPVSRRFEQRFFSYYGYGYYWMGDQIWGAGMYPAELENVANELGAVEDEGDEHLRSVDEVAGYNVIAGGENTGEVDGFLVEDRTWKIRYIVVDTGRWLSHHRVVIPSHWITAISWAEHSVEVSVSGEQLESAPVYPDDGPVTREYEEQYFSHFGREPYWQQK